MNCVYEMVHHSEILHITRKNSGQNSKLGGIRDCSNESGHCYCRLTFSTKI